MFKTPLAWPLFPRCPLKRYVKADADDRVNDVEFATVKVVSDRRNWTYLFHAEDGAGGWTPTTPEELSREGWMLD